MGAKDRRLGVDAFPDVLLFPSQVEIAEVGGGLRVSFPGQVVQNQAIKIARDGSQQMLASSMQ